ncbi:DUF1203 domain-containing protein [Sphingomonas gei]|uniref:DUF1203 domain-containing protein n=1 Tax=Sphingomonas gei TaxID=1395960 RepID=A0A4S1XEZ5_9SPHN|nr:DUF1203 domain-containing protein [Sphingomonas gei]TGX55159.1 DUF1203 domain-containing protein [Sphingomonas gei]
MSYRIQGLDAQLFRHLFGQSDAALAAQGVVRVRADAKPGFPCRITLEDAEPGETLLLLNHTDHAVATPYRNSYAIYVRENPGDAAALADSLPPVLQGRPIALRGYDSAGMLRGAMLKIGDVEAGIEELFARSEIAYIHAHNAAYGCFAARIERG